MMKQVMLSMAAVAMVGCATQQAAPVAEDPPAVKVDRLFPQPDSLDASKLAVKVAIYNPRSKPVRLIDITYEVDTKDVAGVIKGTVPIDSAVDPDQVAEAEFVVEIPFDKSDAAAYMAILAKETVPLEVKGQANFEGVGAVPFTRVGAVATPSLPKFIVHDAQAARYGKEGIDVTFFLRLINENAFTVTVGEVDYALEIYGKKLKEQQAGIGTTLVAGAAQEFEVSAVLEEKTFPGVNAQLKTGKLQYRVTGTVSVNDVEEEFAHEGEIDLDMD